MISASKPSVSSCPSCGHADRGMGPLYSLQVPGIVLHSEKVLSQGFLTSGSVIHNRRCCSEK